GKVGTEWPDSLRVERQQVLEAQDRVGEQEAHQTEDQHRHRVLFPILLLVGVNPHQTISQSLQGTQHRIKPSSAISLEHLHEIKPHLLRDCCERDDVEEELKPVRTLHSGALKFFRPNHGHERIDEQEQGNDAHDEVSHGVLLQFFAEANVKSGDDEEHDDDSDEEQVTHNGPPGQAQ